MKSILSTLILLFVVVPSTLAKSSVWKIEKNGNVAYLAGTVHILRPNEKMPVEYDEAFNQSAKVVFETDIDALKSPGKAFSIMAKMTYPEGESLQDKLDADVYADLQKFFAGKMPAELLNKSKPGMVISLMLALFIQEHGYSTEGVDAIYTAKAKQAGKAIGQLESVDEQVDILAAMGIGEENETIRSHLQQMQEGKQMIDDMIDAVKHGDKQSLMKNFLKPMQETPKAYKVMLVDRNNNWMPKIEVMLKNKEKELIMVGALHLVGKDGLLYMLKQKGYKVTQL